MFFLYRDEHTAAKSSVLENELESCKMLLEEETDNKCEFTFDQPVFMFEIFDEICFQYGVPCICVVLLVECSKGRGLKPWSSNAKGI